MNKSLLGTALVLAACSALHAPAFAAPKNALPPEARTYLSKRATSFLWKRLPIGPKGTKMLVHVWGATRPNTPDSNNSYNRYTDSPFCVDVFAPQLNSKKQWGWRLVSSAAYMDSTAPADLEFHWLQPAKKQGPVLHIISGNGAPGISTYHKLFVWPQGFQQGYSSPSPQEFSSGGSGEGYIFQWFGGVDERGFMTIITENPHRGKIVIRHRWNGERFIAVPVGMASAGDAPAPAPK